MVLGRRWVFPCPGRTGTGPDVRRRGEADRPARPRGARRLARSRGSDRFCAWNEGPRPEAVGGDGEAAGQGGSGTRHAASGSEPRKTEWSEVPVRSGRRGRPHCRRAARAPGPTAVTRRDNPATPGVEARDKLARACAPCGRSTPHLPTAAEQNALGNHVAACASEPGNRVTGSAPGARSHVQKRRVRTATLPGSGEGTSAPRRSPTVTTHRRPGPRPATCGPGRGLPAVARLPPAHGCRAERLGNQVAAWASEPGNGVTGSAPGARSPRAAVTTRPARSRPVAYSPARGLAFPRSKPRRLMSSRRNRTSRRRDNRSGWARPAPSEPAAQRLAAAARGAAVVALVAGAAAHHDRAARVARRRVRLVQERALRGAATTGSRHGAGVGTGFAASGSRARRHLAPPPAWRSAGTSATATGRCSR